MTRLLITLFALLALAPAAHAQLPAGGFTSEGVKFVKNSVNIDAYRAISTKDGGEVVSSDAY